MKKDLHFIVQLNTGSFDRCAVTYEEAEERLSAVISRLPISEVIFGWSQDRALNEALCALLSDKDVDAYFWLPIFSEMRRPEAAEPFVPFGEVGERAIRLCRDEAFEFACPSAQTNLDAALETFKSVCGGLPLKGVFLDRIRYPSAANFSAAIYGCSCPNCRKVYAAHGAADIAPGHISSAHFLPSAVDGTRLRFDDEAAAHLFQARNAIISRTVGDLSRAFHDLGLKVGLDSFAPLLAEYVGQDLDFIAANVDFVKPMLYQRTYAPAGVPFEAEAIDRFIASGDPDAAFHGLKERTSDDRLYEMIAGLQSRFGNICPGIEINRIAPICDTDMDYILSSIEKSRAAGCERIVLSWDILRAEPSVIDRLAAAVQ